MSDVGRLAVVVPSKNRRSQLQALLGRVLAEDVVHEVIVVDDGSTDDTADHLLLLGGRDPRVRRVVGPGQGPLAARMAGVEASTCELVLLLDDDVSPEAGLCAGHLRHHGPDSSLLVLGYMPTVVAARPARVSVATRLYAAEYEGRCSEYEKDSSDVLRHLWMGNLSVARDRFLDATLRWPGPLPSFRHEDTEIGLRLATLGVAPVFDRELLAWHQHHRTLAQFRRDNRLDGAGLAELDREGRDVFGPPGTGRFSAGLHPPLRQLVRACAHPAAYRSVAALLSLATSAAGTVGAGRVEVLAARLLRRVERQHGYLTLRSAAAV